MLGVTGRFIIDALCAGERDPERLAEMAQRRLRAKIGDLRQAVPGRFNAHHALMVKELLAHIDYLQASVDRLDEQIDVMMIPFVAARDRLNAIPGARETHRRNHHRGNRYRHVPVRDPRPFGVVGRALSGEQRVRRETPCHDNQVRKPVADVRVG